MSDQPAPGKPCAPSPADELWKPALEAFAAYEQAKGLTPRTIANRHWMLAALGRATGASPFDISLAELRAHLARGVGRPTMRSERDCYRAFFRYLTEEELRDDNPTTRLQPIRVPRARPRPYSAEQIDRLLGSGAYRRTRAMILIARFQGFRASEIAAVHGSDLDLRSRTIRVHGKGGLEVVLPLHPEIAHLATEMPTDDWWFPARRGRPGHITSQSVSDLMTRARRRAGIDNARLTGHSLRHAYGTDLVKAGVDLRTVQELMRHESLATTQIYTMVDDDQMRQGIERLTQATVPERSGRSSAATSR